MTKTVLCLTIFLSGRKHKPIDFSLSDRKLYSKIDQRKILKVLNPTGSRNRQAK